MLDPHCPWPVTPPPPPQQNSSTDSNPFEAGMGLLVIIFLVWFTEWARARNIDGHFAFAVRAALYPPRATGMHLFFACIGAIWLYLALPLTLLAGLGRRAAAREMTQHSLRTAFWFCLPFLLWIGLLVAAGIKHQLFAQDFGLRDFFFGRFSSAWSGLCFLWCILSTLWLLFSLPGLGVIRLLPATFAARLRFGCWLPGTVTIAATWIMTGWIAATL